MSSNLWIAPFIEHCLATYHLNGPEDPNIRLEDDGSNLRFSSPSQRYGLVNSWSSEGKLNLTDSLVQIEAIISRESLEEYQKVFPNKPLGNNVYRGYFIQLSDFELVFEYATAEPKVHLYVMGFSIVWDRGKINAPPKGKAAKNHQGLKKLMKRAFECVKSPGKCAVGNLNDKPSTSDAPRNGANRIPKKHHTQDIASQIPRDRSSECAAVPSISETGAAPAKRLLGHLESRSSKDILPLPKRTDSKNKSSDQNPPNSVEASPTQVPSKNTGGHSTSKRTRKASGTDRSSSSEAANSQPTPRQESLDKTGKETPVKKQSGPRKEGKSNRPGPKCEPEKTEESVERTNAANHTPGAQPSLPQETPSQNVVIQPNPPKNSKSSIPNSWINRTKIQRREVTTPRNQCEALDQHHRQSWLPPKPGESHIQGHAPSSLLESWNKLAQKRSKQAREHATKGSVSGQLSSSDQLSPSEIQHHRKTPTPQTNSDSDEEPLSWGSSPERASRPWRQLPASSSPPGPSTITRKSFTRKAKSVGNEAMEDQESGLAKSNITGMKPNESQTSSSDQQVRNIPDAVPRANNQNPANEEIVSQQWSPSTRALSNTIEHEVDAESEDSVMDISVPHPLADNSPQFPSSQQEANISSSGPSLPESSTRQVVQVIETPTAGSSRIRTTRPTNFSSQSGVRNSDQSSSQAGKTSSQSRILNTYASNEFDSREELSQMTSNSIETNGVGNHDQIHVMRTPLGMQGLMTQETVSWSGSGSAQSRTAMAISTYRSEQSNPFLSYREIPQSSMVSLEDDQSSMGCTPVESTSKPPKRFASEMSNSQEENSPTKRAKISYDLNEEGGRRDLNNRILARRQKYLSNTPKPLGPYKVYEKFQNDYPNYSGDFVHFTNLCSKLHKFRENGSLKRSFLWDDFVIQHFEKYLPYLEQLRTAVGDTKPFEEYEEYFSMYFSTPCYKKRSLTAPGINTCAAHYASITQSATYPPEPIEETKTSFTGSLRGDFSNLRTHSFGSRAQDAGPSASLEHEISDSSIPESEPNRVSSLDDQDDVTDIMIQNTHETASIELGDEDFRPSIHTSLPRAPSETLNEVEELNENWFLSLRHLRPTSPLWSDDPNTPFKDWARADQNVRVERSLRGGAYIPVDERGVIQHPSYQQPL